MVLARYQSKRLTDWIEGTLEGRFRLTINREKTRIVPMRQPGASLTFLGFTLRYDHDRYGRDRTFLNVFPSAKAQARAREKLRELTGHHRCSAPIPEVIDEVNRWLMGWGNYFRHGHPGRVFASMNWYVQSRLRHHLKRRSQRHLRIPEGESFYALLHRLGVRRLRATRG